MSKTFETKLLQLPIDQIDRNKENPRLVFRPGELDELLESIRIHGVQVPISVYKDGKKYILIDGERRWRCSLKLNLPTIPALVQEKPDALENLILMFNIHSLREQWDLLTIAMKLPRVISLLNVKNGRQPSEKEVSEQTGLNRSVIRRCKLLMELPQEYQDTILAELNKPKAQQKLTEDFFIEMERALTTVERAMPSIIPDRDSVRRILIKKYKKGVINNRVNFRLIAKIARAKNVNFDTDAAEQELQKLFSDNSYSIEAAFANSVGEAYRERDIGSRIVSLLGILEQMEQAEIDAELKAKLQDLLDRVADLLE